MIFVGNVVYVYVCKIDEEKLGGCWWSCSWLGQSNPFVWHPHCVCDCHNGNESTTRDHWFSSGRFKGYNKKKQLTVTDFPCTIATNV